MKTHVRIGCALAILAGCPAIYGHHASNLDYEQDKIGTIEGVVDDIFWANPHIHFYLTVSTDQGTEIWDMEGPNLSAVGRRGMARDSVQIGDRVVITGTLGRDGSRRIWAESIVKADGTLVMGDRP